MAYCADCDWDVFVSYASTDDQPAHDGEPWVSTLIDVLRLALTQSIGEKVEFFFDRQRPPDLALERAAQAAAHSAIMVAIVSPAYVRSERARSELRAFSDSHKDPRRLLVAELMPLGADDSYPEEIDRKTRVEFWHRAESGASAPLAPDSEQYRNALFELASAMNDALRSLRGRESSPDSPSPPAPARPLHDGRDRIQRDELAEAAERREEPSPGHPDSPAAEREAAAVAIAAPQIAQATIAETSGTAAGTAAASATAKAVRAPRGKPAAKGPADTVRKRAPRVQAPAPTATNAHPSPYEDETDTDFIPDDAETERDALGRSALAIALARRLHRIWRKTNAPAAAPGAELRAAFVLHLDARWGGGKTTFANFLARVLDPRFGGGGADFLRQRYADADLGGIFVADPPVDAAAAAQLARQLPDDARRPWIIVPFNAWQAEHCAPPWWVFYQAIRKGCFDAIKAEGDDPWVPRAPDPAGAAPSWAARLAQRWRRLRAAVRRTDRWLGLVGREYLWRLGNPKILSLLLTGAIGGAMLLVLFLVDAAHLVGPGGLVLTGGAGLLAAGLTGIGAIWGLGALFTESIVPGTDTLAERLSLGSGDPFARFRTHFYRTIAAVRRPVMVIVDDLDRCRPDFVVDLIRGIQTLLRSPRVVFLILGDRDWIERAFEAHHAAMRTVDVGPEQSFGARFVEKAIQMSFILPAVNAESQETYVRRVLLGDRAAGAGPAAPPLPPAVAAEIRRLAIHAADASAADRFDSAPILRQVLGEYAERNAGRHGRAAAVDSQVRQIVDETLAIRSAVDDLFERELVHELETLTRCFPQNPRQIKRIVNAIMLYYPVAIQRPDVEAGKAFRLQLALWVIVLTEWPRTWRLLASFPDLVDILTSPRPRQAMRRKGVRLPGSIDATERALAPIRADPELMALIGGGGAAGHARLESGYAHVLANLIPLHSRLRGLPEAAEAPPPRPARRKPRPKPAAPASP